MDLINLVETIHYIATAIAMVTGTALGWFGKKEQTRRKNRNDNQTNR